MWLSSTAGKPYFFYPVCFDLKLNQYEWNEVETAIIASAAAEHLCSCDLITRIMLSSSVQDLTRILKKNMEARIHIRIRKHATRRFKKKKNKEQTK